MLPLPLALRRVLDLTRGAAGAATSRWLGDFGAEGIVVESPGLPRSEAGVPSALLRNKFNTRIDVTTDEGCRLCLRLAALSDIVLFDADDDALATMGLGYEAFRQARQDIIAVSFGEGAGRPGLGVMAAAAALTALFHRRITGEGQLVEIDFPLTRASLLSARVVATSGGAQEPGPDLAASGIYRCLDGAVAVVVRTVEQLAALGDTIERPEEVDVVSGGIQLRELVAEWTAQRRVEDVERELLKDGVPAQRLLTLPQLRDDEHLRAAGLFEPVASDSTVREMEGVRFHFGSTPAHIRLPAPAPGQHDDYVLRDLLGLGEEEIERLRLAGVAGGAAAGAE